jgi:uncharacterized membrane protein YhhN
MSELIQTKKFFHWVFFAVSAFDLIAIGLSVYWMELIFKPLILLSLLALYVMSSERRNLWYFLALLFSLLGDIYLLDKNNMFHLGLGSFLCAQLLFVFILWKDMPKSSWLQRVVSLLPFVFYLALLLSVLGPDLGSFTVPVWVYGVVISMFGALSLLNYLVRRSPASMILLLGAVLFILSDSMIALNKFHEADDLYQVAIMLTYVLAQYFIFTYMLAADRKRKDS